MAFDTFEEYVVRVNENGSKIRVCPFCGERITDHGDVSGSLTDDSKLFSDHFRNHKDNSHFEEELNKRKRRIGRMD